MNMISLTVVFSRLANGRLRFRVLNLHIGVVTQRSLKIFGIDSFLCVSGIINGYFLH